MKNKLIKYVIALLVIYGIFLAVFHYLPQPSLKDVVQKKMPPGIEWYGEHLPEYKNYPIAGFSHVVLSILFLSATPFLFFRNLREKNLRLHRLLGKIYLILGVIIGLSALYISFRFPFAGLRQTIGMVPISIFFIFSLASGWFYIKKKNYVLHRIWMIRSLATALAPMTMRIIYISVLTLTGIPSREFFMESFFIGLSFNLLVTEFFIKKQLLPISGKGRLLTE